MQIISAHKSEIENLMLDPIVHVMALELREDYPAQWQTFESDWKFYAVAVQQYLKRGGTQSPKAHGSVGTAILNVIKMRTTK